MILARFNYNYKKSGGFDLDNCQCYYHNSTFMIAFSVVCFQFVLFYTPPHGSVMVLCFPFRIAVRPSAHQRMISANLNNFRWI